MGLYINNILVGRKKVEWIANNIQLTNHAELRLLQKDKSRKNIKDRILESPLSWKLATGCIAIATDLFHYFIINAEKKDENGNNYPALVTLIDLTKDGLTVVDKFLLDYKTFNTTNNTGIYQAKNLKERVNKKYL